MTAYAAEFIKANEKQKDAQLYEIGRTIKESHARQWEELKRVYATSRKKITDHGQTLIRPRRRRSRTATGNGGRCWPQTQRAERRELWGREDGFLSRLFNGLSLLKEIRQNHEGNAFLIALALMSREGQWPRLPPGTRPSGATWRGKSATVTGRRANPDRQGNPRRP